MISLRDHILGEQRAIELYLRVHDELEDGKSWSEIAHEMSENLSYDGWLSYMQQRFCNSMKVAVLLAQQEAKAEKVKP